MDWGLILGVVGIALALLGLAPDLIPESIRVSIFRGGQLLLALGLVLALPLVVRFIKRVLFALVGPVPLLVVLDTAKRNHIIGDNFHDLTDWILQEAQAGKITLYGELGSNSRLVSIPRSHLQTYSLTAQPAMLFGGNAKVHTYDPKVSFSDQDSDHLYFNVHASRSVLQSMYSARTGRKNT
jgi:hypothetical protein